jgi:hypothetical protein
MRKDLFMLRSWCRKLLRKAARGNGRRPRPAGYRPAFDVLEDRSIPAFLAPASSAAGVTANGMALGDFNGDGITDIVSVGNISGRGVISVSLGNGDGTFQTPIISNSGNSNPLQVRVADFNGDGKFDVVCLGSYYIDSLTVCMGNGDGTFQPPTPYTYSIPPTEIEVADMNNDGHPDLIEGNHFFSTTSVQLNDGSGHFGAKVDSPGVLSPTNVEAADFNGDGKADLISTSAAYYSSGVTVQYGNGNGTLQAPRTYFTGSSPVDETVGDFNGDGKADLAITQSNYSVAVLLGNGDGTFASPVNYSIGTAVLDISKADFNGDGVIDLVERTGAGFAVELGNGDGTFQATSLISATTGSNLLAADFNNDGVTDVAISSAGNIAASMNDSTPINGGSTSQVNFAVSTPATTVAGAAVPVTVTAVDASGNVISDYSGLVRVFSNDPRGTSTSYTFTAADAGTHTFAAGLNLFTAGTRSVLANAPLVATASQAITVTSSVATHLALTTPSTTVAGAPMTFSVVALDAWNNMGATYTGTVHFSTSDAQGTVPADYTFLDSDAGIRAFSGSLATVRAVGQTITATDTTTARITGTSPAVTVTPTTAVSLTLVGGGGRIGSPHTVTVQARDVYGNATNLFNGAVHLTASDPNMTLPATDTTLVNGVGTASVTPMTMGSQTISATALSDATINGTETVIGTAGAVVRFVMTAIPATTAGVAQSFTVTGYDAFGNVAADYTGTVYFTSSDAQAGLPGFYTFTLADAGVHTFSVTLRTAGSQSVTVRDWSNVSLTTTQIGIGVTAAAASSFTVTALHGVVAGTAQSFTVSVRDAFGNLATGYRGTVTFSSSDTQAALPASYTFTAADGGRHTFSMTFKSSGGQSFTVADAANATMLSSQRDTPITAAAMVGFAFRAPSNVVAGTAFNIVVSAVDAYGNTVTGYTGKVHFSGASGGGNLLPADYTFTAGDAGVHTFSVTFSSLGTQTIGVQDMANGSLKGQVSVKVVAGGSGSGGNGSGGGGGGGAA